MYLKADKDKGKAWCCVMCKKEFKGSNWMKSARHYGKSVLGDDIKACTVDVPPEMRCQLEKS